MKKRYGKAVLITGASSGIGKTTAKLFSANGYHVYAVSRHCQERKEQNGTGWIEHRRMDVTNGESVKRVIDTIEEIGIVVHCAGIGIGGPAEEVSIDLARAQMETNYLGVLRVNAQVLPKMRKRKKGLVIIMSSIAGRIGIPFQSHYSSSKFALEAYAECLRLELKPYQIGVTLIEPGDTRTAFTANRMIECSKDSDYYSACEKAIKRMEQDEENGKAPETVAKLLLKVIQKRHVPVRKSVGADYKFVLFLQWILPAKWFSKMLEMFYM